MAAAEILTVLAYVLLLVSLTFGGLLLWFAVTVYRCDRRYKHLPSPKADSWIFGHLANLSNGQKKLNLQAGLQLYLWYRDLGPVFYLRYIVFPRVYCFKSQVVKELLLNSQHLKPKRVYDALYSVFGERCMGYGLVSETYHQKWRMKRAILNPAFKRSYLMGMIDVFNDKAESLCHHLSKKADGQTEVSMMPDFSNVTLDVIAKVAFNIDVDAVNKPHCPFPSAIALTLEGMGEIWYHPFLRYDLRSHAKQYRREVQNAVKLLRRTGRECIEKRIAAKKIGDELPKDILTAIITAADNLKDSLEYGIEEMVDEFVTFFLAGQETTGNLLSFVLIQLGRQPEVAKRCRQEVDEVLGQKSFIEHSDLPKLEYMSRVFKETMRLYPPVSGTMRATAYEIECDGYKIPAGTPIPVSSFVMGRMEEYFDDPLLFNPDRFITKGEPSRHAYAYFPFSIGQRSCIGQHLALIEGKVILGKLLQRFDFRLDQSQRFLMNEQLVTTKPWDGCRNYVTIRN